MRELAALRAESERAERTLRRIPVEAWARPALGEWNLHELAAHLARSPGRITAYLDLPVEDPVDKDRVTYFHYDPEEVSRTVATRAREEAGRLPPASLADAFSEIWQEAVRRTSEHPADRPVRTPLGILHLQEYVATRVLEVVVHHMDLRRALDLPLDPDPVAADITVEILEGLLDGPRPRNLGRDRFILVATGRLPHDDPRFPVMG